MESSQTVWSNILDIDFHFDRIGDTFLFPCSQNWNQIFLDPDIQDMNSNQEQEQEIILSPFR